MPQGHTTYNTLLKNNKKQPTKPGVPAPVTGSGDHVIHEDGTYSNTKSVKKLDLKALKRDDTLVFGRTSPVSSGVVHKIVDTGIYCRPRKDELPDLSRCIFYNWDEIKDLCTEVV